MKEMTLETNHRPQSLKTREDCEERRKDAEEFSQEQRDSRSGADTANGFNEHLLNAGDLLANEHG